MRGRAAVADLVDLVDAELLGVEDEGRRAESLVDRVGPVDLEGLPGLQLDLVLPAPRSELRVGASGHGPPGLPVEPQGEGRPGVVVHDDPGAVRQDGGGHARDQDERADHGEPDPVLASPATRRLAELLGPDGQLGGAPRRHGLEGVGRDLLLLGVELEHAVPDARRFLEALHAVERARLLDQVFGALVLLVELAVAVGGPAVLAGGHERRDELAEEGVVVRRDLDGPLEVMPGLSRGELLHDAREEVVELSVLRESLDAPLEPDAGRVPLADGHAVVRDAEHGRAVSALGELLVLAERHASPPKNDGRSRRGSLSNARRRESIAETCEGVVVTCEGIVET